jgi:hypothetical protein
MHRLLIFSSCAALALALQVPVASAASPQRAAARSVASGRVAAARMAAPVRMPARAAVRFEQQRAVPRGRPSGGQAASRGRATAPSGGQAAPRGRATAPSGGQAAPRGRATAPSGATASPQVARPRGGSGTYYGQAVPRTTVPGSVYRYRINPYYYYYPYAYGAFGLGYLGWGYDPFFWGSGWGYPYGYWGSPYYYGYGWGYPAPAYGYSQQNEQGSVKLDVQPKEAQVYVDGYYVGQVDDFNGIFHHLDLDAGDHRIEFRAEGYEPLTVEMKLMAGRTVTYHAKLKKVGSGS